MTETFFIGDTEVRGFCFIELTKGQRTIVDEDDYIELTKYHWHAVPNRTRTGYYAVRNNGRDENGTRLKVKMHRQITNAPNDFEPDHLNGDTLDNRKQNLLLKPHVANIRNQKSRGGKSVYRGVTKHRKGWRARITVDYRRICLGVYSTEELAYQSWLKGAEKYYGRVPEVLNV